MITNIPYELQNRIIPYTLYILIFIPIPNLSFKKFADQIPIMNVGALK